MSDETIKIVTYDTFSQEPQPPAADGRKSGVESTAHWSYGEVHPQDSTPPKDDKQAGGLSIHDVSIKKLEKELANFMKQVDEMFTRADAEAQMKTMELSEVELSVGITAEGSVSLVGMGAKLANTRTVLLRFKRRTQS
ncbi:hypothetical protein [Floridanema evergladense]|uniref:Pepco domain-containing protein n=1 Tax=Floridaenema evergladense BLCC-F167 TaxID=3153639 RepID=A0ABV4WLM3_9CYAN